MYDENDDRKKTIDERLIEKRENYPIYAGFIVLVTGILSMAVWYCLYAIKFDSFLVDFFIGIIFSVVIGIIVSLLPICLIAEFIDCYYANKITRLEEIKDYVYRYKHELREDRSDALILRLNKAFSQIDENRKNIMKAKKDFKDTLADDRRVIEQCVAELNERIGENKLAIALKDNGIEGDIYRLKGIVAKLEKDIASKTGESTFEETRNSDKEELLEKYVGHITNNYVDKKMIFVMELETTIRNVASRVTNIEEPVYRWMKEEADPNLPYKRQAEERDGRIFDVANNLDLLREIVNNEIVRTDNRIATLGDNMVHTFKKNIYRLEQLEKEKKESITNMNDTTREEFQEDRRKGKRCGECGKKIVDCFHESSALDPFKFCSVEHLTIYRMRRRGEDIIEGIDKGHQEAIDRGERCAKCGEVLILNSKFFGDGLAFCSDKHRENYYREKEINEDYQKRGE